MQCFIIGAGQEEVGLALTRAAEGLGFATTALATLADLRGDVRFTETPRGLVLVAGAPGRPVVADEFADVIAFAGQLGDGAFLIYVADAMEAGEYKRLVRTGSAEWVHWLGHEAELREVVARLTLAAPSARAAKVVSFLPSKGGVGNTTLVVETAMRLSARFKHDGRRLAIVDLNLQGGTVADALDLEPRFNVVEIMTAPERLDEHLVDVFTSRHSKELDVFASPMSKLAFETVTSDIIFTFIDTIAARYDTILFDLPPQWLAWTDTLLQGSDAVVVSGGETVPALRHLTAALKNVDDLAVAGSKMLVVLGQAEVDVLGRVARRTTVGRALAGRQVFFVRRDHAAVHEALNVGQPLMELMPNTRIAKDIGRVADRIATITGEAPGPQPARRGSTT